jgi:WhiB family transcriptional regulator, redox-sensing transcriptional regulator
MTVHTDWREDPACRNADPDLFFSIGTTGTALRQIEEAKRICRTCPARIQCLAWALDNGIGEGVWGGTTFFSVTSCRVTGGTTCCTSWSWAAPAQGHRVRPLLEPARAYGRGVRLGGGGASSSSG